MADAPPPPAAPAMRKEGYVTKKAVKTLMKQNWKKRYVLLDGSSAALMYFKTEKDANPRGMVPLSSSCTVARTTEHKKPFEWVLNSDKHKFFACATSEEDADEWVAVAQRIIDNEKRKTVAMPAGGLAAVAAAAAAGGSAIKPLETLAEADEKDDDDAPPPPPPAAPPAPAPAAAAAAAQPPPPPPAASAAPAPGMTAAAAAAPPPPPPPGAAAGGGAPPAPPPPAAAPVASPKPAIASPPPGGDGGVGAAPATKITSIFDLVKKTEERVAKAHAAGANDVGQLGVGSINNAGIAKAEFLSALKQKSQPICLAAGHRQSAAITTADQLFMWGEGSVGQLGNDASLKKSTRPYLVAPLRTKRVLAVACGGSHTLAVVVDGVGTAVSTLGPFHAGDAARIPEVPGGTLMAWGSAPGGALGLGPDTLLTFTPQIVHIPGADGPVTRIAAGLVTSAAIVAGKELYVWGDASHGRLGLGDAGKTTKPSPVFTPTELQLRAPVHGSNIVPVQMALGGSFSAFLARPTSDLSATGGGILLVAGALGADVTIQERKLPEDVEGGDESHEAHVGGTVSIGIRKLASDTTTVIAPVPVPIAPIGHAPSVSWIAAGPTQLAVINKEVTRVETGQASLAQKFMLAAKKIEAEAEGRTLSEAELAASAAPAPAPTVTTTIRGVLYTAGFGYLGHEENGRPKRGRYVANELRPVGGLLADEDIAGVACGFYFTLARNVWGELYAFGINEFGNLNIGKYVDAPMPVACVEATGHHYEQVVAGTDFVLGLQYPGLLGDAKARVVAKNAFQKWRKKAAAKATMAAGSLTDMEFASMMDDVAADEGVGDELKALGMSLPELMQAMLRANKVAEIEERDANAAAESAAAAADAGLGNAIGALSTLAAAEGSDERVSTRGGVGLAEATAAATDGGFAVVEAPPA